MITRICTILVVLVTLSTLGEGQGRRQRGRPQSTAEMKKKYPEFTTIRKIKNYQLRQYPAGKWLKIATKPKLADVYYTEIQQYINGTNTQNRPLALGVPMVIRFDMAAGHEEKFTQYLVLRQQAADLNKLVLERVRRQMLQSRSGPQSWSRRAHTNRRRQQRFRRRAGQRQRAPSQQERRRMMEEHRTEVRAMENAATAAEKAALAKYQDDSYATLTSLIANNDVTIFSYLNEDYHTNPPQPLDNNVSILSTAPFNVYSMSYNNMHGIEDSYEVARNLTMELGRSVTSYYLADYMYFMTHVHTPFYFEIWVPEIANQRPLN